MYRQVSPQVDLPALEHEVLAFWREERIFERSIEQSAGRPLWVFYEGPPTANGMPGTHHVEARVIPAEEARRLPDGDRPEPRAWPV